MKAWSVISLSVWLLSISLSGLLHASESLVESVFLKLENVEDDTYDALMESLPELRYSDRARLVRFQVNCHLGHLESILFGVSSSYPHPLNSVNKKSGFALYWRYVLYKLGAYPRFGNIDSYRNEARNVSHLMFRKELKFKPALKIVKGLRGIQAMDEVEKFYAENKLFGEVLFPIFFRDLSQDDITDLLEFNFRIFQENRQLLSGSLQPLIRRPITLRCKESCGGLLVRYILFHLNAYPRTDDLYKVKWDAEEVIKLQKKCGISLNDAIASQKKVEGYIAWNTEIYQRFSKLSYLRVFGLCAIDQVDVRFEDLDALTGLIFRDSYGHKPSVHSAIGAVREYCAEIGFYFDDVNSIVESFKQGESLVAIISKNLWKIVSRGIRTIEPALIEEFLPNGILTTPKKSYILPKKEAVRDLWKRISWDGLLSRVTNGACSSPICAHVMMKFIVEEHYNLESFIKLHANACNTFSFLAGYERSEKAPMTQIKFYEQVLHLSLDEFKQVFESSRMRGVTLNNTVRSFLYRYTDEYFSIEKEEFKRLVVEEKLSLAEAMRRMVRPVLKGVLTSLNEQEIEDLAHGQFCLFELEAIQPIQRGLSRFIVSRYGLGEYISEVISRIVINRKISLEQAVEKAKSNKVVLESWAAGRDVSAVTASRFITAFKNVPDSFANKKDAQLDEYHSLLCKFNCGDLEVALKKYYLNQGYIENLADVLTKKTLEQDLSLRGAKSVARQELLRLGLPHLSDGDLKELSLSHRFHEFDRIDADTYSLHVLGEYFSNNIRIQKYSSAIPIGLVKDHKMSLSQAVDTCVSIAPYLEVYTARLSYPASTSSFTYKSTCYLNDADLIKSSMAAEVLGREGRTAGRDVSADKDERLVSCLGTVIESFDTFRQKKWMSDPVLKDQFYKKAAARLLKDVKCFAPYYPKSRMQGDGNFYIFEQALTGFWSERKLAMSLDELQRHRGFDARKIWLENFTDEQMSEFAKIWFYLLSDNETNIHDIPKVNRAIFTDVLYIYYSHVEPVFCHYMLQGSSYKGVGPTMEQPLYVRLLVTRFLDEGAESIPHLNALESSDIDHQALQLKQDYPYLDEINIFYLIRHRILSNEDRLNKLIQNRCIGIVPESRMEDKELYQRELVDWLVSHTELSFKGAVESFQKFLADEQQEYHDRGWGFSDEEYEQLVWDVHIRQRCVSEALYRPVNRVIVNNYQSLLIDNPLGLEGRGKTMKTFIEELCELMAVKDLRGALADIILGPYRSKIIEDQIDQAIFFPAAIKKEIVADIVDKGMEPLQAVARQVRVVTGLVFPKAEFKPEGWLRRLFVGKSEDCIEAEREHVEEGHYSLAIASLMLYQGESYVTGLVRGYMENIIDYNSAAYNLLRHDEKILLAFSALRMRQIPQEDYDLPRDFALNLHSEVKVAFKLAERALSEAAILNMQPFELICLFRDTHNIVPQSVLTHRDAFTQRMNVGREAARARFKGYVELCKQLDMDRQDVSNSAWGYDGRNPKFIYCLDKVLVENSFKFIGSDPSYGRLSVSCLRFDPFLKPSGLDELMPDNINDDVYFAMRDQLIKLTQLHIQRAVCKVEAEQIRVMKESDYKEKSKRSLKAFFYWGGIGALDNHEKRHANLTADQLQYRRRIALVYERLLKPMIDAKNYGELMGQLTNIIENGDTCIDACRKALIALEERPEVGLFASDAPDLFERLALVLRDSRLKYIRQVALQRSHMERYQNEELEFEFFLMSALRAHMSLWGLATSQFHGGCARYEEDKLNTDTVKVMELYLKNIIQDVTASINPRPMPAGDRNVNVIYLEQVVDWADKTPWYCNKMDLDVELLDENAPKPIVVRRLLQYAGYLEDREIQ